MSERFAFYNTKVGSQIVRKIDDARTLMEQGNDN